MTTFLFDTLVVLEVIEWLKEAGKLEDELQVLKGTGSLPTDCKVSEWDHRIKRNLTT